MTLIEKAAYIKGLADGLDYDKTTAEGKLINALIDIVGELATAQNETDDELEYLNDYIEEIDEDLGAAEEELYDLDDDDCDCDCDCEDCCSEDGFEVTCPSCGETIVFDDSFDPDEELICPHCKEKIVCDEEK